MITKKCKESESKLNENKKDFEMYYNSNYYNLKLDTERKRLAPSDIDQLSKYYSVERNKLYQFELKATTEKYNINKFKYYTNKYKNNINFDLITNSDCKIWTGLTKHDVINRAEFCQLIPEDIFMVRVRIYRYFPYELMSHIFGRSKSNIRQHIVKCIPIIAIKYAKKFLINVRNLPQHQYWNRIKLVETNSKFAKRLRGIKDNDDIFIGTEDSTHQYIQTPQTDHLLRRRLNNAHKKRHLVKVHIWCTSTGRPIYALTCLSDGKHNDGRIFNSLFDTRYHQACYDNIISKNPNAVDCNAFKINIFEEDKYYAQNNENICPQCGKDCCTQLINDMNNNDIETIPIYSADSHIKCDHCKTKYCSITCKMEHKKTHGLFCEYNDHSKKLDNTLNKKNTDNEYGYFKTLNKTKIETLLEMRYMSSRLIKYGDQLLSDNGYLWALHEARIKQPASPPSRKDINCTVQECNWTRSITCIRQVQEIT